MRGVACFHSKGFEEDFGPQDADRYSDVAERGQGEKRAGEGVRGALDEVISELCARAGDGPDGGGTLLRGLDRRIDEDDVKGGGVVRGCDETGDELYGKVVVDRLDRESAQPGRQCQLGEGVRASARIVLRKVQAELVVIEVFQAGSVVDAPESGT